MKVINPTNTEIGIKYKGRNYSCPANDSVNVPDDVAVYWRDMIHNFLQLAPEESAAVAEVVEQSEVAVAPKATKKTKK